jgi:uncharacterized protein (TIGR02118 family)
VRSISPNVAGAAGIALVMNPHPHETIADEERANYARACKTRKRRLPLRFIGVSTHVSGNGNFSSRRCDTSNSIPQEDNMIRFAVLYPQTSGGTFNMDYYLNKHVPMVISRLAPMGLVKGEIDEGMAGFPPDQPAPFVVVGYLVFEHLEDLQRGLATHGAEIMGDIPNFTNIQPVVQINRIAL